MDRTRGRAAAPRRPEDRTSCSDRPAGCRRARTASTDTAAATAAMEQPIVFFGPGPSKIPDQVSAGGVVQV